MTTLRSADDLVAAGLIAPEARADVARVAQQYAVALTPHVVALIGAADDARLARQFVPDARELERGPEERDDPIGDAVHSPVEGIVHRYPDRVLLKLLTVCPVYCRFCFRRETVGPGAEAVLSPAKIDAALAYIAGDPAIWEVILTGGDPLALSVRRLREVMLRLAAIPHVKVLRLHTRVPVVEPSRIDAALVAALRVEGAATYVALHANHPGELNDDARAACARLIDAGIPMVSQSVLLAGVNDDVDVLAALMRAFVETRIKPYYLHHPDLAPGTSHFRCSIAQGQALTRALQGRVSGLAQPAYVLDIPGGYGKAPIGPAYLREGDGAEGERSEVVTDFRGRDHIYPPPQVAGAVD